MDKTMLAVGSIEFRSNGSDFLQGLNVYAWNLEFQQIRIDDYDHQHELWTPVLLKLLYNKWECGTWVGEEEGSIEKKFGRCIACTHYWIRPQSNHQ